MRAAVLTARNSPLELREIQWSPLCYGQVMVKIISSGICGAQLAEIRGDKNETAPIPRLLGHEACVRVLEVGEGVTTVKPGDKCVAHWRRGSGVESQFPMWSDGTKDIGASGIQSLSFKTAGLITTFATHSVISENRLTAVPEETPDELCCLLGCSLSTALGTMENEANLKIGESVLIIGCGGLGLNLILAARLRKASRIVGIETHKSKYESGISLGAESMRPGFWLMEKESYDVIIDTTGEPDSISEALRFLAPSGRFIMVGQPKPGQFVQIPNARNLFNGEGCSIRATQGGRFNPSLDIPRYAAAHAAGRISLDGLITHRFPLSQINTALDIVRRGQAGRILIDCTE